MSKLSPAVPRHLGFIVDGNRRWAKDRGKPSLNGHQAGYENLKIITSAAIDRGVEFVSAYVFSTENWQRARSEVRYLMDLVLKVFTDDLDELNRDGIRLLVAGSRQRLSHKLIKAIEAAEKLTKGNKKGTLVLCFNYSGQQEVADAATQLIRQGVKSVQPADIEANLYHAEVPPVDLVIRTSGEQRLSNFMLWRAAYAELLFVPKHWPDFSETDLDNALADFAGRQRRFGR